ncbi:glycosyltransferase family 2 protein [Runella aurantiaca]|uniref:Glycosyltransferase n=1 Tax=Runella aurantiaca TaxID=2282308 RepID=A0A369I5M2_9BACT|nr:glycosyltransferase [Runella aurantiaca]RDB04342.1 glycosyltransferase [Runella aurantiaca]
MIEYLDVEPLVSVFLITYNHENYISKAIDSVLMQKCNFMFEIVIGEDCSDDNTKLICEEYSKKYSNIKIITSSANVGLMNNFLRTSKACKGKYIAMLEGDDYWTDPNKLQKQVDFLESRPDFILCFHNRNHQIGDVVYEDLLCNYDEEKYFIFEEIIYASIHTLTVVFRNIFNEHPYPKQFHQLPLYDFALWAYLSLFGKCAYLNFTGATYRLHANGFYSGGDNIPNYVKWMNSQITIRSYFPKRYQRNYKNFILMLNFMLTEELRNRKVYGKYGYYLLMLFFRSIAYSNYEYVIFYKSVYKTVLKKYIKSLF